MRSSLHFCALVLACGIVGCASAPQGRPSATAANAGERAAAYALKLVGAPYRYGGASPSRGFDCSGLVRYSYHQAGVDVPRSTEQQRRRSKPIRRAELRRGDLVFFDEQGKKSSHVGLYVGGGEFVHAPSSGKPVRKDRLDAPYWRKHLSEIRRVA
jgi:cell wall-associated NlpC family hydrolase